MTTGWTKEYQLNNRKEENEAVEAMKNYDLKVNNLSKKQLIEWNELVEIGFNKIISPISKKFYNTLLYEINKNVKVNHDTKLFGDGKSAEKILKVIKSKL